LRNCEKRKPKYKLRGLIFNGKRYDPIDALRYHFKEFYIWVGFFIVINGTLLTAYRYAEGNSHYLILIAALGCIVTILCFWCSQCYYRCIKRLSKLIDGKSDASTRPFFRPLEFAKVSTIKTVSLFIAMTPCFWGVLLFQKIVECVGYSLPHYKVVFLPVISMSVICALSWLYIKISFWRKQKHGDLYVWRKIKNWVLQDD